MVRELDQNHQPQHQKEVKQKQMMRVWTWIINKEGILRTASEQLDNIISIVSQCQEKN